MEIYHEEENECHLKMLRSITNFAMIFLQCWNVIRRGKIELRICNEQRWRILTHFNLRDDY